MAIDQFLPQKLKKRIIVLFFIFTLIFSALLSVGYFTLSQQAEKKLQSIDMGLAVERIRTQYLNGENIGRSNRFFHGEKFSSDFPDWIRTLPEGFHKVQRDHLIWHVMVLDYPDQRYILLRDYTLFEATRLRPMLLGLIVLASSLVLSLILVWITLFYVIYPIEKLEKNIREKISPHHKNQLSSNYAEHEIGQLAQAFDEVYDKLNQALQRERLFTADVSHELRTPLMVILSSAELLLANSTLQEKTQQRIHNIQHAAQQILQRLEVYLALARQTNSALHTFKQLSILEIAQSVIEENQSFAKRNAVTLQLHTNNMMTKYPADFCYTILSNLMRNSIEYAGAHSTVTLVLHSNGFVISDNGVGILPEFHPQIFEAFTSSRLDSKQHLGLGLSLVQRICHYLNWKIEFVSEMNQGTRFTIITNSTETIS